MADDAEKKFTDRICEVARRADPDEVEKLLHDIMDPTSKVDDSERADLLSILLTVLGIQSAPFKDIRSKWANPRMASQAKSWIDQRRAEIRAEIRAEKHTNRMFWIALIAAAASALSAGAALFLAIIN